MTTQLTKPMTGLLKDASIYRFARLWKLVRTDAVVYYFTDHDRPLVFEGNTYVPAGGFQSSSSRVESNAQPATSELLGVLTSNAITFTDLRAKLFDNAIITSYIVDWRYPWASEDGFKKEEYTLGAVTYNDQKWSVEVMGKAYKLMQMKGRKVARSCDAELGDARCGVLMAPLTSGVPTAHIVTAPIGVYTRTRMTCDLSVISGENNLVDVDGNPKTAGWYNDGELTWLTGSNAGTSQKIRKSVEPTGAGNDGIVWLWTQTQFDIDAGDTFKATPGCNKLAGKTGHCLLKFKDPALGTVGNVVNFRGSKFSPGNKRLQATPAIKS